MITKARKWIMVASLMLTMCFAINNSTSAKAAVVTEVATQNLKLNNAINEAKNEYEGDVIGVGTIELGSVTLLVIVIKLHRLKVLQKMVIFLEMV